MATGRQRKRKMGQRAAHAAGIRRPSTSLVAPHLHTTSGGKNGHELRNIAFGAAGVAAIGGAGMFANHLRKRHNSRQSATGRGAVRG